MRFSTIELLGICLVALGLASCSTRVQQKTISHLNLKKYSGEWHEIGRLPNFFERDVVAAKAIYQEGSGQSISVKNIGVKSDGKVTSVTGKATIPDPGKPGKLKVRFDRFPANLFAGDYWVLALDGNYERAMIGSPSRKFLWLLSKNPTDKSENFVSYLHQAEDLGYPVSKVIFNPKRLR